MQRVAKHVIGLGTRTTLLEMVEEVGSYNFRARNEHEVEYVRQKLR